MAKPSPQDATRLDRLSALLTAVAPRVAMDQPVDAHPHTLRISLLAAAGEAPHGMVVAHCPGAASSDLSVQVRLIGPAAPLLMREFVQPLVLPLAQAQVP